MSLHTLVTHAFDAASNGVRASGVALPAALFHAKNVTAIGEDGFYGEWSSYGTLADFFTSKYGFLCFPNPQNTDHYFVLCLTGKLKGEFYYCTGAQQSSWKSLGTTTSTTALHELYVGPGMVICLCLPQANNNNNKNNNKNAFLQRLPTLPHVQDATKVVKVTLCPHMAKTTDAEEPAVVYLVKGGNYDGVVQALANSQKLTWHSIDRTTLVITSSSTFHQPPTASGTGAVRISCDQHSHCHDIMQALLVVKDHGITDLFNHQELVNIHQVLAAYVPTNDMGVLRATVAADHALAGLGMGLEPGMDITLDVDVCPAMGLAQPLEELRLSFVGGVGAFSSTLPDVPHLALVASFERRGRRRAFVYEVENQVTVKPWPSAVAVLESDVQGKFVLYQGQAVPLYLLSTVFHDGEGAVTYTLEQVRLTGTLCFECSPDATTANVIHHGCGLAHYRNTTEVVWPALRALHVNAALLGFRNMILRPALDDSPQTLDTQKLLAYYWGEDSNACTLDAARADVVVVASNQIWSQDTKGWSEALSMSASEANLLQWVEGSVDGRVPAFKITMDQHESVDTFAKRLSRMLWNHGEGKTFAQRTSQGGPWGVLAQWPGSELELALVMPFQAVKGKRHKPHVVVPTLAVRKQDAQGFERFERCDLSTLPSSALGFHVAGACVTAFRISQTTSTDTRWLAALGDVKTLLVRKPAAPKMILGKPKRLPRVRKTDVAPAPEEEEEDMPDKTTTQSYTHLFVGAWPFVNAALTDLYEFGHSGRNNIRRRQELVGAFVNHVLPVKRKERPAFHLASLANCRLLTFLPPSTLDTCDRLAEEWRHQYQDVVPVPSWGNFDMVFRPWDGEPYHDHVHMTEWVVKVPTEAQWQTWTVEQKLELLARLLGFHVFYVNWVRTNGTTPALRDYHAIIEQIAPRLGLLQATRWVGVEDVVNCNRQTRSYKELTVFSPAIFEHLVATVVGKRDFVDYVIGNPLTLTEPGPNANATKAMANAIQEMVKSLSMVYPHYTLFPLVALQRQLRDCEQQLDYSIHQSVAVAGPTTSGKSSILSSLLNLFDTDSPAPVYEKEDDAAVFVDLYNSMAPARALDVALLHTFIADFGRHREAVLDDAQNVDVLFNPGPDRHPKSTEHVTSAVRQLTFGNVENTSSHAATIIRNNTSLSPDCIRLHLRSWAELESIASLDPTFKLWIDEHAEFLQQYAGKTLTLRLPGGYRTAAGQRGQVEAILNLLHGVRHDGSLVGEDVRLRHRGILKYIELARPMTSSLPALEDFIGSGESDPTIANLNDAHKLWLVPFTHLNNFSRKALDDALDIKNAGSTRRVVAIYNYPKNPNGTEILMAPTAVAQHTGTTIAKVVKAVEKAYQAYVGTQLSVVAVDAVSCAAMVQYLKRDDCLGVHHLKRLPMAVQASGLGHFLFTTHHAHVQGVLDIVGHAVDIQTCLHDIAHQWTADRFPVTHETFAHALRELPVADLGRAVLTHEFKGSIASSVASLPPLALSFLQQRLVQRTHHDKPSLATLADFCPTTLAVVLQTYEAKAQEIEGLDDFVFKSGTRQANEESLYHLRRVLWILDQQVSLDGDDLTKYLDVKWECEALYRDLTNDLTYNCRPETTMSQLPYDDMARHLKTVALNVALCFLQASCLCLGDHVKVDMEVRPATDQDARLPLAHVLARRVHISRIAIHGEVLDGPALQDHQTVLLELGKYVMYRVVEQMCSSTLKVDTFVEPTGEVVGKSLLHFLRGNRRTLAEAVHKMRDVDDVDRIAGLMRRHLVRTFENFTVESTLHCLTGEHHPGVFVTTHAVHQAEDRDKIATTVTTHGHAVLESLAHVVQDACFSPNLVHGLMNVAGGIMNVNREGLGLNDHHPFSLSNFRENATAATLTPAFRALLRKGLTLSTPLSENNDLDMATLAKLVEMHHRGVHVDKMLLFPKIRQATAHILGMDTVDVCSAHDFAERLKQRDPSLLEWQQEFVEAVMASHDTTKALDHVYAKYVEKQRVDPGQVVKTMGMAIAQLLPLPLAYLCPGDRHVVFQYHPTTHAEPLTPQTCWNAHTQSLTPQHDLGVPDDLWAWLQGDGMSSTTTTTLADIRERLETYDSTGDHHVDCVLFELRMAAIKKKRAISILVIDGVMAEQGQENVQIHEWLVKPQLPVRATDACAEILREAGGSYRDMADAEVMLDLGRPANDSGLDLDILVLYNGKVYLCQGQGSSSGMDMRVDSATLDHGNGKRPCEDAVIATEQDKKQKTTHDDDDEDEDDEDEEVDYDALIASEILDFF